MKKVLQFLGNIKPRTWIILCLFFSLIDAATTTYALSFPRGVFEEQSPLLSFIFEKTSLGVACLFMVVFKIVFAFIPLAVESKMGRLVCWVWIFSINFICSVNNVFQLLWFWKEKI